MQHTILQAFDHDELSKQIEEAMTEGWELHGNLVFAAYYAHNEQVNIYAQALTNEQDSVEPLPPIDNRDVLRLLAEALNVPEDQLPPDTKEKREQINEILQTVAERLKDKDSETE